MKKPVFAALALAAPLGFMLPVVASEPAQQPAPDGAAVFQSRCQGCHSVAAGAPGTVGPNLNGVIGRAAGSSDFRYSPALKESGLTWSREEIDAYIAAPTRKVPGTRMMVGLNDPAQRAAVIDYLASTAE